MGTYSNFFASIANGQAWKAAHALLLTQLDTDIPSLQAQVSGRASTSVSSLSVGTGSKSFTIAESGRSFTVGDTYQAYRASAPTTYMIGAVASFSGGVLGLTVNLTGGAGGPYTDWVIVPVGSLAQPLTMPRGTLLSANATLSAGGVYLLDAQTARTHNMPASPQDCSLISVSYDTQAAPASAAQHTLQTTDGAGIGQAANTTSKVDRTNALYQYSSRLTLWVLR
jgi:hypothetical protein